MSIGPKPPNDEEMAAIAAAVEAVWPRQSVEEDVVTNASAAWKFANRWWQGSAIASRGRPKRPTAFS